jgi:ATP-binding protein involved in chromosome partitioning
MADITEQDILNALKVVQDPDLHKDIVSLGFVKNIKYCDGNVKFDIELTTPACPVKDRLKAEAHAAVKAIPGMKEVNITMTSMVRTAPTLAQSPLKNVGAIIAVASGKGGVGKSTVVCNLAVALAKTGARVGLMDADVYGPSIPAMFGISRIPDADAEGKLIPLEAHGVKLVSMGFLATKDTPVVWRGPMATKLVQQFLGAVAWGELDYLLIDLPPGTGDIQLTLTQSVPLTGAVIVTTPQDVARNIAQRGLRMFQQVQVPILGIVENMSYFECGHCHEKTHVFSQGGGHKISSELGIPFLGEVPLNPELVQSGDAGTPVTAHGDATSSGRAFLEIAGKLAQQISIVTLGSAGEFHPTEFATDDANYRLKLTWNDGRVSDYRYVDLRNACPCAACVDEWTGKRRALPLAPSADLRPLAINPVGRYAVQINWSDGHNTGLYSHSRLREMDPKASKVA